MSLTNTRLIKALLAQFVFLFATHDLAAQDPLQRSLIGSPEEWYFHTPDDVQHYVYELGKGDTVVTIHGGYGAEHSYLLSALEPLKDEYRFVFYDQRGSLRTPASDSLISLEAFVADLEALRLELKLERVTLFAHSMGAAIAYAYLGTHPERVRGIVLSGPILPDEFAPDPEKRRASELAFVEFAQANAAMEKAKQGLNKERLQGREWSRSWRIDFASGNIYDIARWREVQGGQAFFNSKISRLVYANSDRSLLNGGLTALRNSSVPIHIILGDHDLIDFGPVFWPEVVASLPNAKITVVDKAGHNAWIDRPEEYRSILRSSLAAIFGK